MSRLLERAKGDPFNAYRETAVGNFELYRLLLDCLHQGKTKPADLEPVYEREIARQESSVFYLPFGLAFPVLYTAYHSGPLSNRSDQRAVSECLRLLNEATTFSEFVIRLGINRIGRPGGHVKYAA